MTLQLDRCAKQHLPHVLTTPSNPSTHCCQAPDQITRQLSAMQAARRGCWQQARPLPFSSSQHSVTRCSRRSRRSTGRGRAACVRVAATHVPYKDLLAVAEATALAGAEVVMAALDKPRSFSSKSATIGDIVTDTDRASEAACVAAIQASFPDHLILGEEGGVIGSESDYLWCIDPIDGTCNFAHAYQSFCVSIGVLRHALPVAGCVVEFVGGPGSWRTRVYKGARNLGSMVDGKALLVSNVRKLEDALVATELNPFEGLEDTQQELYATFAACAMGVRASGSAAANLCHLAAGQLDAYYQFMLKPYDVAAGIVILEEAGGRVTTADGAAYSVFDRSLLATNDALYEQVLAQVEGPTSRAIREGGVKLGVANVPKNYRVRAGAQLE